MAKHGLTPKQKAFADEYIANKGNATQAAISAGYKEGSAKEMGYENLTKPHIREYIDKRLEDKMADLMSRGSQVVEQLMSYAFRERQDAYSKKTDLINNMVVSEDAYEFMPSIEESNKSLEILSRIMGLGRSENADLRRRLLEAQVRRTELENERLEAQIRPREGQEEQIGHFIDRLEEFYDEEDAGP